MSGLASIAAFALGAVYAVPPRSRRRLRRAAGCDRAGGSAAADDHHHGLHDDHDVDHDDHDVDVANRSGTGTGGIGRCTGSPGSRGPSGLRRCHGAGLRRRTGLPPGLCGPGLHLRLPRLRRGPRGHDVRPRHARLPRRLSERPNDRDL